MDSGMNEALKAYIKQLQGDCAANSGNSYALLKCFRIVSKARSAINPARIGLFKQFGEFITKRVAGHFSKEEHRVLLQDASSNDLRNQVQALLEEILDRDELCEQPLGRKLRSEIQRTRDSLDAFLSLEDPREVILLKSCPPQLSDHLSVVFKPRRKRAGSVACGSGDASASGAQSHKRSKPSIEAVSSSSVCVDSNRAAAVATPQSMRSCKPFTGGWAIMVGLELKGKPCSKSELASASAEFGLCREPLIKLQRTVAHAGQWYSPWSSCKRLIRNGWVSKVGQRFQLTDSGKAEAMRCAQQRQELRDSSVIDVPTVFANGSIPRSRSFSALHSRCDAGDLQEGFEEERSDSVEEDHEDAGSNASADSEMLGVELSRTHGESMTVSDSSVSRFSILIDIKEKPVIRAELRRLLPLSTEIDLPGVDYAFGRSMRSSDWSLGNVLVERKTVHDYLGTLETKRGHLQASVQAALRSSNFHVAIVLEGANELKQHPQQDDILRKIYSSAVDVLVTSSLHDTANLLAGLAATTTEHDGWTLSSLPELLQPLYEPSSTHICEAALVSIGIARPVAQALACGFSSLKHLLGRLQYAGEDAEVLVGSVAADAGLTLYQAGKALRLLGVQDAPLSRKRGPRGKCQAVGVLCSAKRWKAGVLRPPEPCVELGSGLPKAMCSSLRKLLHVESTSSVGYNTLRVRHGSREYMFEVGDGMHLCPGRHWLILPGNADPCRVAHSRARAYLQNAVISSSCASPEQAARHVAACAASLANVEAVSLQGQKRESVKNTGGLAGVFRLAHTAGGALPEPVAVELASRLLESGCTSLLTIVSKLRNIGPDYLLSLGVRDLGVERAAAVRELLLSNTLLSLPQ